MSAKPENLPPTNLLAETIDFLGNGGRPGRGPNGDGPSPAPEGRHRYTFGSGARPLEGYTIKRAIGRGGFGEVYYATSDSGKEVALKLITRNLEIERRGVAQCMNLKCQNLLAIHDIKGNDDGDTFVIMEYVAGPNLAQVLADYPQGMPIPEVRAWLRGLVEGVSYLHDHGIVHRDLKPANLFMEEGVVKIGDYGLSKMITSERVSNHSESIGTCHYMAPEISTGKYNKPIDIYAIGVILYRDDRRPGPVRWRDRRRGPDQAPDDPARPGPPARAVPRDRRPRRWPRTRRTGRAASSTSCRPTTHRRSATSGSSAMASPPRRQPPRVGWAWCGSPDYTAPPPVDDDILRIGDEEPILYIGPDAPPPPPRFGGRRPRRDERRRIPPGSSLPGPPGADLAGGPDRFAWWRVVRSCRASRSCPRRPCRPVESGIG